MTPDTAAISDVRRRLERLYDPQLFQQAAGQMAALLGEHFARCMRSEGRVLNWADPAVNVAAARDFLTTADQFPATLPGADDEALLSRVQQLLQTMLARGHNLHDPRYVGHQVPPSVPLAALFQNVAAATNQVMAIYEMSPWSAAVERTLVEELGAVLGFPVGGFSGMITNGGSLANLTALLTARNVVLGGVWEQGLPRSVAPPVMVVHADAHYCVARSAGILGLGTNQVVRAALDARRRMDPERLDAQLTELRQQGHPIVAVVGCACATPIGAFDPLNDVADVCRRHDVWLHVDGAHGAAAAFSPRYRHLVSGLERADSLIWDAHKMLHVPALSAFVFYRDRGHRFEAFRQNAPYVFDPSAPGLADYDSGLMTVECTKQAAGVALWGLWSLCGRQVFADLVDATFDMGRQFYEKLLLASDFEPLHEPECNIVVFRHVPDALRDAPADVLGKFQLDLRREVIESGEYYLVPTTWQGSGALRTTIINPLTTTDHLDGLLEALRTHGRRLV